MTETEENINEENIIKIVVIIYLQQSPTILFGIIQLAKLSLSCKGKTVKITKCKIYFYEGKTRNLFNQALSTIIIYSV